MHCVGAGVDALTLAATILTVVVIDAEVFDDLFGEAVRYNFIGGAPFLAIAVVTSVLELRQSDGTPSV